MAQAVLVGEECYPKYKVHGYCIIVNNVIFSSLPDRFGSSKDADDLADVLTNRGVVTDREDNLTKKEVMDLMFRVQNLDYSEIGCLFVILLSHGEIEAIYSTNSEIILISYPTSQLKIVPPLLENPKYSLYRLVEITPIRH